MPGLRRYEGDLYAQTVERMRKGFIGGYCRGAVAGIRSEINRGKKAVTLEIAELESRIGDAKAIMQPVKQVIAEAEAACCGRSGVTGNITPISQIPSEIGASAEGEYFLQDRRPRIASN